MLQHLRDNSRGVISFILIGFLVIIFALTGVEALFNWDTTANQAAKVNGEVVTEMDVARAIGMQKQQMLNSYGDQIPAEFLSDEYLRKPAVDNLVQRLILSQAAKSAGMAVGSSYLSEQIVSAPQFKNQEGVFDNNLYQRLLRNLGYTHTSYSKVLSEETLINQLQSGVAATAFLTPLQRDDIVALSFQTRNLQYGVFSSAKVRHELVINDADIQAYYDSNQNIFVSEEQVSVDYISLSVSELMKEISISDAQLREQYEQDLAAFVAAPERQAAHILIEGSDADKVKEVSEKLASGTDFSLVASVFSDDMGSKEQGGDLGFTKGDAFPPEFEAALAALKVGEVSAAVKTDAGTHFIKLLSERGSLPPSFDEKKVAIEEQLKRAEAETLFVSQLEKLRDLSYNAENLSDVAQQMGLNIESSGFFERNKGKGVLGNPKVVEAAFSNEVLMEGNSSEVIEIDSSNVLVLKKTDHKPSQVKILADVKDQIINVLKDEGARALLTERATKILVDLQSGVAFDVLAKEADLEVKQVKDAHRNTSDVDRDVLRYAFAMAKPQAGKLSAGSVVTASGDVAVVILDAVVPGAYDKVTDEQKVTMAQQLAEIYGKNDFSGYQKFLKDSAEIVQ